MQRRAIAGWACSHWVEGRILTAVSVPPQFLEGQLRRMHVAAAELERVADTMDNLQEALLHHPLEHLEPVPPASVLEEAFPVLTATEKSLSPRRTPREVRCGASVDLIPGESAV